MQVQCESQMAELRGELKLKQFELERAQLLNEESINNYHKLLHENEKLNKKQQITQSEYYAMQMHNEKRIIEIESELNEKNKRLESYEKVEAEMDAVIRQVAEKSKS
jgi:hypothetical protein